jgi:uncharacterized protein
VLQEKKLMKKIVRILVVVIFLMMAAASVQAQAQDHRALAEELINILKVKDTMERSFTMIKQMVSSQIGKMTPPHGSSVTPAQISAEMEKIMDVVGQELNWDKLKNDYVNIYADTFTEQELKDIIAFYKSPSGQAFIAKQPELMKRSMQISEKMMTNVMPKVQEMSNQMRENLMKSSQPQKEEKKQ